MELHLSCINPLLSRYSWRKMLLLYRELIQIMLKWRMTVYNLTHGGQDKMVTILQTAFSNRFSRMKMYEFQLKFHWSLFLKVKLTTYHHHWFRYWLEASEATNNYQKQWWLVNQCIYVSLGCNGLKLCHMKQKKKFFLRVAWKFVGRLPSVQCMLMPWVSVLADHQEPCPDSMVHGANMGPIWGRQDPGGPHVGPMNLAI